MTGTVGVDRVHHGQCCLGTLSADTIVTALSLYVCSYCVVHAHLHHSHGRTLESRTSSLLGGGCGSDCVCDCVVWNRDGESEKREKER